MRGVKTSIPFHLRVLENETFRSGNYDTSFIETEMLAHEPDPSRESEARSLASMLAAIACAEDGRGKAFAVTLVADSQSVALERVSEAVFAILLAGRQLECSVDRRANGKLEVRVGASAFTLTAVEAE